MIFMQKKHKPKFHVPNLWAKKRSRVRNRWRVQRGTDSKLRVKRKGYGATPGIGYKNADGIRFARPDGSFETLIHNSQELMGIVGRQGYVARFAHGISVRKRLEMQKAADANSVRIVNRVVK